MKCEEMIKEIYFVAGVLEGLTYSKGSLMTEAMESKLSDCVDRLELVGAQLLANSGTELVIEGIPSDEEMIRRIIKSFNDKQTPHKEKGVKRHERPPEAFGRVYAPPEDASDQ